MRKEEENDDDGKDWIEIPESIVDIFFEKVFPYLVMGIALFIIIYGLFK